MMKKIFFTLLMAAFLAPATGFTKPPAITTNNMVETKHALSLPQKTNAFLHLPSSIFNLPSSISHPDTIASDINLGEVVVTSLRIDRQVRMLPTPMTVATTYDFQKYSATTLSHLLQREPGIAMGSDGIWSTSLSIRGMGESRQVVLIDGNRVETATDLTAAMSMIDVNDIRRVEVIRGAQSSLYGTGAMGGIINIITRDGTFAPRPHLSGNITSGYATGNSRLSNYGAINAGAERWYLRLSGSYTSADDMRTPEGILPNSQFTTNNLAAKAGLKPMANHLLKIQYQRNGNSDVGIPGGSAFPGPAEATYTDINRDLLSVSYGITGLTDRLTSLEMNIFRQFILRDVALKPNTVSEATLPNGSTRRTIPEIFTPGGRHRTLGGRIQGNWELSEQNSLIIGVDVWGRKLTTSRGKFIRVDVLNPAGEIISTNRLERGETPIPVSHFNSGGIFFQDEARWLDGQLTMISGGRIDRVWITNEAGYDLDYLVVNGERNNAPPMQRLTFPASEEQSISWSANTGLLWKVRKDVDVALNLARSFRAPSLEERFKYIDLGNLVLLGDPALDPEQGYSADIGLRVWKPAFTLQSELFVNALSNMIVEVPGEFVYTLVSTSQPDTLPALIYDNVSRALLYGFNLSVDYNIYEHLVAFGSAGYVRGINTRTDEDLPRIPPLKGRAGVRYTLPAVGTAGLSVTAAANQEKIAAGERATGGYYHIDATIHSRPFDLAGAELQLFAGMDNITDRSYTNHLATNRGGISIEPGRNFFTKLIIDF